MTIVVVIADGHPQSVTGHRQTGLLGDVGELPVALIPIEFAGGFGGSVGARQRRAVQEQDVDFAIAVIVECGHAGADRLDEISLA